MIILREKFNFLWQFLLDEMEEYVKAAGPFERKIFLSYIKNCGLVHVTLNVCSLVASVGVILGPLVLPQSLPTEAKYPFSVENHPNYEIIYIHQTFAGILCSSIGSIDCQIAMLLWFSIARLELLSLEMKNITNVYQFYNCVRKHQFLLWYLIHLSCLIYIFRIIRLLITGLSTKQ